MQPAPDYLPLVYGAYAAVSVVLTIFLARTLSVNGRIFLEKVFVDDRDFGDAVNRLLVVGFYLAAMHFANLWIFNRIRRGARQAVIPPPIVEHGRLDLAAAG